MNKHVFTKISKFLIDISIFLGSFILASFIVFKGIPDPVNLKRLYLLIPFVALVRILCFHLISVYSIAWKFFSINDAIALLKAVIPVTIVLLLGRIFLPPQLPWLRIPLAIIGLEFLLTFIGTAVVRVADRLAYEFTARGKSPSQNILLIGSGEVGNSILKELNRRRYAAIRVVGFVDDDPKELNSVIRGTRVLGNTTQIPEIVKTLHVDEAIITNPDLAPSDVRRIIDICRGTHLKLGIFRSSVELLYDDTGISEISLADSETLAREQLMMFKALTKRDYDAAAEKAYPVNHVYEANKPFSDPGGLSGDLLIAAGTMIKLLHLRSGASVLDLGCGCGWTSIMLARCGFEVTGLDINAAALEIGRHNAKTIGIPVEFISADMQNFTVDRLFDAIVIFDSLHHCLRERSALVCAEGALRPGGKVILCEQAYPDEDRTGIMTHEPALQAMQEHGTIEKGLGTRYLIRRLFDCGFEMVTAYKTQSHYSPWLIARKPRAGIKAIRSVYYASDFEEALWFSEWEGH